MFRTPESNSKAPARWITFEVTDSHAGQKVQEILTGQMGISRRMIQRLTRSKGIRLNNKPAFLERIVRAGDLVKARISSQESGSALAPQAINLDVLYEDLDLLIINKPPGLAVHPTEANQTGTLANGVAAHLAEQGAAGSVRPVHRLDYNTSGVIAFAKNQYSHQSLDRQLKSRQMKRTYVALVEGVIKEEEIHIDLPIGRQQGHPTKRMVKQQGDPAVTHLKVREHLTNHTLVELQLETGRTHQIRVHLAHLGHPIVGDSLYGARPNSYIRRQALHALRLELNHPTNQTAMVFEAPLPGDLQALRKTLAASGQ